MSPIVQWVLLRAALVVIPLALLCPAPSSLGATFVVTNTNDGGSGSLREAIHLANAASASVSPHLIQFGISGPGPHRIQPTNALPSVTHPLVIDGFSQLGSASNSLAVGNNAIMDIELNGTLLADVGNSNGLRIATSNCLVRGLAIVGFPGDGIRIQGGPSNKVSGCFIGLEPAGTNAPGNGLNGIALFGAHGNSVGGLAREERNVIAGHQLDGIYLSGSSSNWILGNYSGTDASGTRSRGNLRGVTILSSSPGNLIGGPIPGAGNLLSGNRQRGLNIASSDNRIEGNIIGLTATGSTALGNGTQGIYLDGSSNRVGGLVPAAANLIASNGFTGITIGAGDTTGNALLGNRIFGNGGLGIDLDDDQEVATNDSDDADEGANRGQNHPLIVSIAGVISGSLTSSPSTTFRVEFFASPEPDSSLFGEGQDFLGATNVTTATDGRAQFDWAPPGPLAGGSFITATATDPAGNTSEFSPAFVVSAGPPTNTVIRINGQPAAGPAVVTNEALVSIDSPFPGGTIIYSLEEPDVARGTIYGGAFRLAAAATLRAIAFGGSPEQSSVATPVVLNILFTPVVIEAPVGLQVIAGDRAVFAAQAAGTPPLFFQWRRNGVDLPDATNAVLALENVQPAQAGAYTVFVTNGVGGIFSPAAQLAVDLSPGIAGQPVSAVVPRQGTATFCVDATGSQPLRYQWRHNGVNISGETNRCLTNSSVDLVDGGAYAVVVANEAGAVTSASADLLVELPPLAPGDAFAARVVLVGLTNTMRGTNATFTRESGERDHAGKPGGRSAWHAWRAPTNGLARFRTIGSGFDTLLAVYTGDQLATLTELVSDEDAGGFFTSEVRFRCIADTNYAIAVDAFAGRGGTFVLDWSVEPTEDPLPRLLSQPTNQTVVPGATVTLTVVADSPNVTYQWHFNGVAIASATSATLVLNDVQTTNVGYYTVGVTNAARRGILMRPVFLELGQPVGPVAEDKFEDAVRANGAEGGGLRPASGAGLYYRVGAGDIGVHYFGNALGTTASEETNHCGVLNNATLWVFVTATDSGTMVVDTAGSSMATVMAIYVMIGTGRSAQPIVCGVADPSRPGDGVRATFTAQAGKTYPIVVDGLNRATGLIQLNWALGTAPSALAAPLTNLVIHPGEPIVLLGPAGAGVPPPRYQWRRNGLAIPGATNRLFEIPAVATGSEGRYSMTLVNGLGVWETSIGTIFLDLPLVTTLAFPFDDGRVQGWTMEPATRALRADSSGGNSGGCLVVAPAAEAFSWYWSAPQTGLGDHSRAYGGWLQFDLLETGPFSTTNPPPLVVMQGNGLSFHFEVGTNLTSAPGAESKWNRYRVPFLADGWPGQPNLGRWRMGTSPSLSPSTAQFRFALSNLQGLRIRGRAAEFLPSRLDNVAILAARSLAIGFLEHGGVLLSWPESLVPYQLMARPAFDPAAPWSATICFGRRTLAKGLHQVDVCGTNAAAFYQLTAPE